MRNRDDLLNCRADILRLAAQHGANRVRLFGSLARGEETATSDVDVLVNLDSGRSLLDLVELKRSLEQLLDCEVDVVTEAGLSPHLADRILSEAVPL